MPRPGRVAQLGEHLVDNQKVAGSSPAAPTEVEILPSLRELEETIRREHEACSRSARTTLEHAVKAGEALLEVRRLTMPNRAWIAWLAENFPKDRSQAYAYMRIAYHQGLIPAGATIKQAEELAKGLPSIDGTGPRTRCSDAQREDAKRLRHEGRSYKEIAKELGLSPSTVYGWFNGGTKRQRQREATRALEEKERDLKLKRAVATAPDAIAAAYAAAERLDDVLADAQRQAVEPEARRDLARAYEFRNAMRDMIVRALGVEP